MKVNLDEKLKSLDGKEFDGDSSLGNVIRQAVLFNPSNEIPTPKRNMDCWDIAYKTKQDDREVEFSHDQVRLILEKAVLIMEIDPYGALVNVLNPQRTLI